jgi:hypothetical protein
MLIEFDKDIGQEIREREIFFFNNVLHSESRLLSQLLARRSEFILNRIFFH